MIYQLFLKGKIEYIKDLLDKKKLKVQKNIIHF